ncbi:MAG TPA: hypothetical protein VF816_06205 [Rhodocyclaceae bacterium]
MPRIPEHPRAAQRSRAPTGKSAKPPAAGPPPEPETTGPRERIRQGARDIAAGILDDDRRRIPDDVPGPREKPERTKGARVKPEGVDKRK